MIINTPVGKGSRSDDFEIRRTVIMLGAPYTTTLSVAQAVVNTIESVKKKDVMIKNL